jgi:hypothetical protein
LGEVPAAGEVATVISCFALFGRHPPWFEPKQGTIASKDDSALFHSGADSLAAREASSGVSGFFENVY